jgi:hypothetical protein
MGNSTTRVALVQFALSTEQLGGESCGFARESLSEDEILILQSLFRLLHKSFRLLVLRSTVVTQLAVIDT